VVCYVQLSVHGNDAQVEDRQPGYQLDSGVIVAPGVSRRRAVPKWKQSAARVLRNDMNVLEEIHIAVAAFSEESFTKYSESLQAAPVYIRQMHRTAFRTSATVSLCVLFSLIAGCQRAAEAPVPAASQPQFMAEATIKDLMLGLIDTSADVVWLSVTTTVSEKGVELEPEEMDVMIDKDRAGWNQRAKALHDAAMLAVRAAESHDADKIFEVGETIEHACEGCHRQYWYPNEEIPELPKAPDTP
jgi:hypothetical protein